jgi:hypothetical protein
MMSAKRNGFTWTIPEILRLQREWELLELSVAEIAELHERTIEAICYKLEAEKFATHKEALGRLLSNKNKDTNKNDLCQKKKHLMPSLENINLTLNMR